MNDLNIKEIRQKLGFSQTELAKRLGVDYRTIQNWEYGKTIPTSKHEIIRALIKEEESHSNTLGFSVGELRHKLGLTQAELAKKLGVHENTIQNWERGANIPKTRIESLRELWNQAQGVELKPTQQYFGGEGSGQPGEGQTIVPLIPISAQGGTLNDFTMSVMEYDCEKVISPIKGVDYAMTVSGDSMSPEYPSGCQILIKKINERAFIDWGKVFVLDTVNGTIIKKLMPTSDPEKVLCVSINPNYPSFEVCLEHVTGVYRVLMCMSLK